MSKKMFRKFLYAAVIPFSVGVGFLASSLFNSYSTVKTMTAKQKAIDEINNLIAKSESSSVKADTLSNEVLTNRVPVINSYMQTNLKEPNDTLSLNASRLFNPGYILMDDGPVATGADGKLEPMSITSSWKEVISESDGTAVQKTFSVKPYEDKARDIKHKYLSTFKTDILDLNVGDNLISNDGSAYYEGRIDLAYLLNNASTSVFEIDNTKNRQMSRITPNQGYGCWFSYPERCYDGAGDKSLHSGIKDFNVDNSFGANKAENFNQVRYPSLTPSEWNADLLDYNSDLGWSLLQKKAPELNKRAYEQGFNTLDKEYETKPENYSSKTNLDFALHNTSFQRGINFRIADTSKSQTLFTAFSKSAYSSAYPSTFAKNNVKSINDNLADGEEKEPLLDFRFNNIYNRYSGVIPGQKEKYPYYWKGNKTENTTLYKKNKGKDFLYDFFVNENDRSNSASANWYTDYVNFSDSFVSLVYNHVTNKIELVTGTNDAIADLNYDNLGVAVFASKLDVVSTRNGELDTNVFDVKARHNAISTNDNLNKLGKVNKVRFYGTPKAASKVLKPFYGNSFNSQIFSNYKGAIRHQSGLLESELIVSRGWAKNSLYAYSPDFGMPSVGYLPSNFSNLTYDSSTSSFKESKRIRDYKQLNPYNISNSFPDCSGSSNICIPGSDFIHPDTRSSLLSELSFLGTDGKPISYSLTEFNSNLMESSKVEGETISYSNTKQYEEFLSDLTKILSNGSDSIFQSNQREQDEFNKNSGKKVGPSIPLVSFSTFSPASIAGGPKSSRSNGTGWLAFVTYGNPYDDYANKGASNSSDESSLSDYIEIKLDRPTSLKEIQLSINTIEHDAKWPRIEVESSIDYLDSDNTLKNKDVTLFAEDVALSNMNGSVFNPVINNTEAISYFKNNDYTKFINTSIRPNTSNSPPYNYPYPEYFSYSSGGSNERTVFINNQKLLGKDNSVTFDDLKKSIEGYSEDFYSRKTIGKIKTNWYILDSNKSKKVSDPSSYSSTNDANFSFYTLEITNNDKNYDKPIFRSQFNNRFFKSQDSQILDKYSVILSNPDNQEFYNSIVMPKVNVFAKKKNDNPSSLVPWINSTVNLDDIDELLVSKKDKILSSTNYDNFYTSDLSYKLPTFTISNSDSIEVSRQTALSVSIEDAFSSLPSISQYLNNNDTNILPQSLIRSEKILEAKPMEGQSSLFQIDSKFKNNENYEIYATRRRNNYKEFKSNKDYDKFLRSSISTDILNDTSNRNQIWQLYTNRSDKYVTNGNEYTFGDIKDSRRDFSFGRPNDYNSQNSIENILFASFLKPMSIYKDPYGSVLLGQTVPNMPLLLEDNISNPLNYNKPSFWVNSSLIDVNQFSPFSFGTKVEGIADSWDLSKGSAEENVHSFFNDDNYRDALGKNRFYYANNQYARVLDPIDPSVTLGYVKAGESTAQFSSLITSGSAATVKRNQLYNDYVNKYSGIQLSNLKNLRRVYKNEDLIYGIQKEEQYNYEILPKGNKVFSNNVNKINFQYEVDPLPFDKSKFLDDNNYLLGSKTDDSMRVRYNIEKTNRDLSSLKELKNLQIFGYSSNFEKAAELVKNPADSILSGMDSYSSYNLWNNIPIYNLSLISSKTNSDIENLDISVDLTDFEFEIKQGNVEIWLGNQKINPSSISDSEFSSLRLDNKVSQALKSKKISDAFKLKIADGRRLFYESSSKIMIPIINFNFGSKPESIKKISYSAYDANIPVFGPLKIKATNKYNVEYSTNSLNLNGMQTYDVDSSFNNIIIGDSEIEWSKFNGFNSINISNTSDIFKESEKCLSDDTENCDQKEIKQKVVTGAYIDFPRASYIDVMDAANIFNTYNTSESGQALYPWPSGSSALPQTQYRLKSDKASTLLSSFILKELLFYSREQEKMISNGIGNYSEQYEKVKNINTWQKLSNEQKDKLKNDIFDIEKNNNPFLERNNFWSTQTNWVDSYYRNNLFKQNLGFEDNRDLPNNTYINAYGVNRNNLGLHSNGTQQQAHWDFIPSLYVGNNNFSNNLNNNFYNTVSNNNTIRGTPNGPSYNLYDFDKAYSIFNFEKDTYFHSFSNNGAINSGFDSILSYMSPESKDKARQNLKDSSLPMGWINTAGGIAGYSEGLSQSIHYSAPLVNEFLSLSYSVKPIVQNTTEFADPSKNLNQSAFRMFVKFNNPLSEFPAAAFRTGMLNSKLGGVKIEYEVKEMTTTETNSTSETGELITTTEKKLSEERDLYSLNDEIVTFNKVPKGTNPFSSINYDTNYFDYSKSSVFTDLYDKIFITGSKTGLNWVNNPSNNKEIGNFYSVSGDSINSSIQLASFDASSLSLNDDIEINLPSYFMFSDYLLPTTNYINSLPSIMKGITNAKKQTLASKIISGDYSDPSDLGTRFQYGIGRIESEEDYSGTNGMKLYIENILNSLSGKIFLDSTKDDKYNSFSSTVKVKDFLYNKLIPLKTYKNETYSYYGQDKPDNAGINNFIPFLNLSFDNKTNEYKINLEYKRNFAWHYNFIFKMKDDIEIKKSGSSLKLNNFKKIYNKSKTLYDYGTFYKYRTEDIYKGAFRGYNYSEMTDLTLGSTNNPGANVLGGYYTNNTGTWTEGHYDSVSNEWVPGKYENSTWVEGSYDRVISSNNSTYGLIIDSVRKSYYPNAMIPNFDENKVINSQSWLNVWDSSLSNGFYGIGFSNNAKVSRVSPKSFYLNYTGKLDVWLPEFDDVKQKWAEKADINLQSVSGQSSFNEDKLSNLQSRLNSYTEQEVKKYVRVTNKITGRPTDYSIDIPLNLDIDQLKEMKIVYKRFNINPLSTNFNSNIKFNDAIGEEYVFPSNNASSLGIPLLSFDDSSSSNDLKISAIDSIRELLPDYSENTAELDINYSGAEGSGTTKFFDNLLFSTVFTIQFFSIDLDGQETKWGTDINPSKIPNNLRNGYKLYFILTPNPGYSFIDSNDDTGNGKYISSEYVIPNDKFKEFVIDVDEFVSYPINPVIPAGQDEGKLFYGVNGFGYLDDNFYDYLINKVDVALNDYNGVEVSITDKNGSPKIKLSSSTMPSRELFRLSNGDKIKIRLNAKPGYNFRYKDVNNIVKESPNVDLYYYEVPSNSLDEPEAISLSNIHSSSSSTSEIKSSIKLSTNPSIGSDQPGFGYLFATNDNLNIDELLFRNDGIKIGENDFTDIFHFLFLSKVISYKDSNNNSFTINNPNYLGDDLYNHIKEYGDILDISLIVNSSQNSTPDQGQEFNLESLTSGNFKFSVGDKFSFTIKSKISENGILFKNGTSDNTFDSFKVIIDVQELLGKEVIAVNDWERFKSNVNTNSIVDKNGKITNYFESILLYITQRDFATNDANKDPNNNILKKHTEITKFNYEKLNLVIEISNDGTTVFGPTLIRSYEEARILLNNIKSSITFDSNYKIKITPTLKQPDAFSFLLFNEQKTSNLDPLVIDLSNNIFVNPDLDITFKDISNNIKTQSDLKKYSRKINEWFNTPTSNELFSSSLNSSDYSLYLISSTFNNQILLDTSDTNSFRIAFETILSEDAGLDLLGNSISNKNTKDNSKKFYIYAVSNDPNNPKFIYHEYNFNDDLFSFINFYPQQIDKNDVSPSLPDSYPFTNDVFFKTSSNYINFDDSTLPTWRNINIQFNTMLYHISDRENTILGLYNNDGKINNESRVYLDARPINIKRAIMKVQKNDLITNHNINDTEVTGTLNSSNSAFEKNYPYLSFMYKTVNDIGSNIDQSSSNYIDGQSTNMYNAYISKPNMFGTATSVSVDFKKDICGVDIDDNQPDDGQGCTSFGKLFSDWASIDNRIELPVKGLSSYGWLDWKTYFTKILNLGDSDLTWNNSIATIEKTTDRNEILSRILSIYNLSISIKDTLGRTYNYDDDQSTNNIPIEISRKISNKEVTFNDFSNVADRITDPNAMKNFLDSIDIEIKFPDKLKDIRFLIKNGYTIDFNITPKSFSFINEDTGEETFVAPPVTIKKEEEDKEGAKLVINDVAITSAEIISFFGTSKYTVNRLYEPEDSNNISKKFDVSFYGYYDALSYASDRNDYLSYGRAKVTSNPIYNNSFDLANSLYYSNNVLTPSDTEFKNTLPNSNFEDLSKDMDIRNLKNNEYLFLKLLPIFQNLSPVFMPLSDQNVPSTCSTDSYDTCISQIETFLSEFDPDYSFDLTAGQTYEDRLTEIQNKLAKTVKYDIGNSLSPAIDHVNNNVAKIAYDLEDSIKNKIIAMDASTDSYFKRNIETNINGKKTTIKVKKELMDIFNFNDSKNRVNNLFDSSKYGSPFIFKMHITPAIINRTDLASADDLQLNGSTKVLTATYNSSKEYLEFSSDNNKKDDEIDLEELGITGYYSINFTIESKKTLSVNSRLIKELYDMQELIDFDPNNTGNIDYNGENRPDTSIFTYTSNISTFINNLSADSIILREEIGKIWKSKFVINSSPELVTAFKYSKSNLQSSDSPENGYAVPMLKDSLDNSLYMAWGIILVETNSIYKFYGSANNISLPNTISYNLNEYEKANSFDELKINNKSKVYYYLVYKAPNTDIYKKLSDNSEIKLDSIPVLPDSFFSNSGNTDLSIDSIEPERLFVVETSKLNMKTRLLGNLEYKLDNSDFEPNVDEQGTKVGLAYHQNAILKIQELLNDKIDKITSDKYFIEENEKDKSTYEMLSFLEQNNNLKLSFNIKIYSNSTSVIPSFSPIILDSWDKFIDWKTSEEGTTILNNIENNAKIEIEILMSDTSPYFFTSNYSKQPNDPTVVSDIISRKPLKITLIVKDKSLKKISPIDIISSRFTNPSAYKISSLIGSTNDFRKISKDVIRKWENLIKDLSTDNNLVTGTWTMITNDNGSTVINNFLDQVEINGGISLGITKANEMNDISLTLKINDTDYAMWSRTVSVLEQLKNDLLSEGIILDYGNDPGSRIANIIFRQSIKSDDLKIIYDRYTDFEKSSIKTEYYSVTTNDENKNNIYMKFNCNLINGITPYYCKESFWLNGDSDLASPDKKFVFEDMIFDNNEKYEFNSQEAKNNFFSDLFNPKKGIPVQKGFDFNNPQSFKIRLKTTNDYIFSSLPETQKDITFITNIVSRSYVDTYSFEFNPFGNWKVEGKSGVNALAIVESEAWQNLIKMYSENKIWLKDDTQSIFSVEINSAGSLIKQNYVFGSLESGILKLRKKEDNGDLGSLSSLEDISRGWNLKNGDIITSNFSIGNNYPGYAINVINSPFGSSLSKEGFSYEVSGLQDKVDLTPFQDVDKDKPFNFSGFDGEILINDNSSLLTKFNEINRKQNSITYLFYDLNTINIDDLSNEYVEPISKDDSNPNNISSSSKFAFVIAPKSDKFYFDNIPANIPFEKITIKDSLGNDKEVLIFKNNGSIEVKPQGQFKIRLLKDTNRIIQYPKSISVDKDGQISLFYSDSSSSITILSIQEYLKAIFENNSSSLNTNDPFEFLEFKVFYISNSKKNYVDLKNIYESLKDFSLDTVILYIEINIKDKNKYTFSSNPEIELSSIDSSSLSQVSGLDTQSYSYELKALNNPQDSFIKDTILSESSDFYKWFNIFPSQNGLIPYYTIKGRDQDGYLFKESNFFDLVLSVTDSSEVEVLYTVNDINSIPNALEIPVSNKLKVLFVPKDGNLINYKNYHRFDSPTENKPVSLPIYYNNPDGFKLILNGLNSEATINTDWITDGQETKWILKRNGEVISTSIGSPPLNIRNGDIITVTISLKVDKNIIYYWDTDKPIIASKLTFEQEAKDLPEKQEGGISSYKTSYIVGSISAFILFIPFAIGLKALIVLRNKKKEEE